MGRLRGAVEWLRWEMGRRIEVDGVIRLIIAERLIKGGLLVAGGIVLITAGATTDLHQRANDLQVQLALEPGRHLLGRLVAWILDRLGSHPNLIGLAAIAYGLLECVEGIGLALRRRWAEYLVVLATSAFLPLEVSELLHHPTPLKAGAFLVNVAIVVYLVWRKRLFMERRPVEVPSAA
ncbi:MAG TPA: DUF2127 domain-containing protein [Candidatus Dormibacteraeota bacterium]|jgi:uncharacterized membrane protein (DUF2068 family)|nr:DUF2127 domain-containing protein [Candidatus Dormibacteraeota bacterium]